MTVGCSSVMGRNGTKAQIILLLTRRVPRLISCATELESKLEKVKRIPFYLSAPLPDLSLATI
jgi:hypothetical protein